ncbi:uncharacterized protein DFL_005177 [Arthrobotrys flagrans]|uniref:Uncharacterized protein n=1 Tax=Arthrobotrys flagrans TaxID=97331 RepID=A0A437A739_ARTFL|nr:hypothetical protein DFL_005177 [Arthrobotrys flagrans]
MEVLAQIVQGTQQLRHQRPRKIIKLKLPKPALQNLGAAPNPWDSNTKIKTTLDKMASTSSITLDLPTRCSINENQFKLDQNMLETLGRVTIRHIWATSRVRRCPGTTMAHVVEQPAEWIVHLECKGYKSIGSLFRIGMITSTKILVGTLWAALKAPPKYFDLSPVTKSSVHGIQWRDVEQFLERLQSTTDTASTETETSILQATEKNVVQPDFDKLMASPVSPLLSESTMPGQPPKTKKRKYRDLNAPLPPGETWLNMPELSSPLSTPPDTQRRKLRQGRHFRNVNYSADLESSPESDEDGGRIVSDLADESEENEENSESSSGDEYQESEKEISEDGNRSISEVTDSDETNEEGDEPPRLPRKRCTPLKFWGAKEIQKNQEMVKKALRGTARETVTETTKGGARENTVKEKSPAETRETREDKNANGNQQKSSEVNAPISSTPQTLDPTKEPQSQMKVKDASGTNNGTADLVNQNPPKSHSTSPEHPVQKRTSRVSRAPSPLPDDDMVYFSPGIKAQEILTEFKALRNLTKHNYDHYKNVERKVAKISEDQFKKDEKLDILIQEMGEVRESMKELTSAVTLLFAFCKGQDL